MTDPELPADHTGAHSCSRHLYNLEANMVWEGTAVDEHPSQLVHPALALERVPREQGHFGLHLELFYSPNLRSHLSQLHSVSKERLGLKCAGRGPDHH